MLSESILAQKAQLTESVANDFAVAVLQPGYMPWLGFFEQMSQVDVFVMYDDVQFDKNGWRNRNRIKSQDGPHWLSVPVHASIESKIMDVTIDQRQKWAKKHLGSIEQFYKKAPYRDEYLPVLKELLSRDWEKLVDLDLALIETMKEWFGIRTPLVRSSELGVGGDRNMRLLDICKHFGAARYYSGKAAECYLDGQLFQSNGIQVVFQDFKHPEYPQLHGEFFPYLSAIDVLLNCGPDSKRYLVNNDQKELAKG